MNKTETALKEAIESKDYKKAITAFAKFVEMKSSSDEAKESYFKQIEELKTEEATTKEVVEKAPVKESKPRVEKRGKKAKVIKHEEVVEAFENLLILTVNYQAQCRVERSKKLVFARRLSRRLNLMKKQLFR